MKLTKNKLLFGILIFWLITNLLVFFDIQYFYLRAIFSFIFLITIPGLLIMLMFKVREISFWEYLVYMIGLSIAFLMFGGLFNNWFLPLVEIGRPLSLIPLLISFNVFLLIFWIIAYKRNNLPLGNSNVEYFIVTDVLFKILVYFRLGYPSGVFGIYINK